MIDRITEEAVDRIAAQAVPHFADMLATDYTFNAAHEEFEEGQRLSGPDFYRRTKQSVRAEIRAILTAAAPHMGGREADGWQPIESAPLDQPVLIAFRPKGWPRLFVNVATLHSPEEGEDQAIWLLDDETDPGAVAHWRPLPPPPGTTPPPAKSYEDGIMEAAEVCAVRAGQARIKAAGHRHDASEAECAVAAAQERRDASTYDDFQREAEAIRLNILALLDTKTGGRDDG